MPRANFQPPQTFTSAAGSMETISFIMTASPLQKWCHRDPSRPSAQFSAKRHAVKKQSCLSLGDASFTVEARRAWDNGPARFLDENRRASGVVAHRGTPGNVSVYKE